MGLLYTTKEISEVINVSESTIEYWIKNEGLETIDCNENGNVIDLDTFKFWFKRKMDTTPLGQLNWAINTLEYEIIKELKNLGFIEYDIFNRPFPYDDNKKKIFDKSISYSGRLMVSGDRSIYVDVSARYQPDSSSKTIQPLKECEDLNIALIYNVDAILKINVSHPKFVPHDTQFKNNGKFISGIVDYMDSVNVDVKKLIDIVSNIHKNPYPPKSMTENLIKKIENM